MASFGKVRGCRGDGMKKATAESIQIGSKITGSPGKHLGSDVIGCREKMGLLHLLGHVGASKTEIPQFGAPLTREKDVGRFEIAVDNSVPLCRLQRRKNFNANLKNSFLRKAGFSRCRGIYPFMQRSPLHELHHQSGTGHVLFQMKNLHHPRMINHSGEGSLIPEQEKVFVILGSRGFQDFQGNVTVTASRFLISDACPKNPSASTLSRDFQKFVTADFLSDPHLGPAIRTAHK